MSGHTVQTTNGNKKQDVQEAAEAVKDEFKEATSEAKEKVSEVAEQVQQQASQVAAKVQETAKEKLNAQKGNAAASLRGVANALHSTSSTLEHEDQGAIAGYTNQFADQIESMADYISNRNLGELLEDVQDFARRQPELFIGGAFALGVLAARFLKSSQPSYGRPQTYQSQMRTNRAAPRFEPSQPRGRHTGQPATQRPYRPQGN